MVDVQLSFSSLPTQDNDNTEIATQKDGVASTTLEKSESFFQREEAGTEEEPGGKNSLESNVHTIANISSLDKFLVRRQELIDIEKRMHFSYDLEATLTDEERAADQILAEIKKRHFKHDNYNIVIHDFFKNFVRISYL
jgi:hypothetical protein